ncbi:serine O-acetyltransferase EpsC [Dokdonia sp.]|uniref:serine O-acetyltransferase EpsC n=1 Tax=Dokdonia sp. TaxID=2024995 RepID=UPI003262DDB3
MIHNWPLRLKCKVEEFTKELFYSLYEITNVESDRSKKVRKQFIDILEQLEITNAHIIWEAFVKQFSKIQKKLELDAQAAFDKDPAASSIKEVYLAYPGFYAIAIYRMSHVLLTMGVEILPRMMSEYTHGITGTDIHPGAQIGDSFFIDHATGIVIGQTSIIKNNVSIYQGVTLGGVQVSKELVNVKRHPTIENNVTIYANATILGGDITIGENCIIGANVWITESIPPNTIVSHQSSIKTKIRNSYAS